MKFKNFYRYNDLDLDKINKALFEEARDYFSCKTSKKGIKKVYLMTDDELDKDGFFRKYPHLK